MEPFNDFNNPQVAGLPAHLRAYIVPQYYQHYTPIDQAVWRYVMRQNYSYLKDVAYYPYIPGLKAAGLTIERIPDLQEMNDALGKIGWGAVTVDGFIPPSAFMEYQAYKVLVIAADIRTLQHIEYTPAPDIIHESAGHAPIIAEPDYHRYLSYFGSIGTKAMFSAGDMALYEAIRKLSILKEMPNAVDEDIRQAEEHVAWCQDNMGEPSEMALLSRLHWWTVEYGLIGTLTDSKIYGAGLLSSIAESVSCMQPDVKKLPYTIDAINYGYDITKPQPQLFVTPDFQNLINVLEKFADTMAFRNGGAISLQKAIIGGNTCTAVYSSGLQVSGTFTQFKVDNNGDPCFIKLDGPAALACNDKQLTGQGRAHHADGFSSPVGKLKGITKPLESFNETELRSIGIIIDHYTTLNFESGLKLSGNVTAIHFQAKKILLISFSNCTVNDKDGTMLFDPSWGIYDMAVGQSIVSVFGGAADKNAFEGKIYQPQTVTTPPVFDQKTLALQQLYKQIRHCRETLSGYDSLTGIWKVLNEQYTDDWLCAMEILEIINKEPLQTDTRKEIYAFLKSKAMQNSQLSKLIDDGLALLD